MMANLGVENNSKIQLSVTELPTGNFVKFKPQSTNFLTKISDPRAVLEHKLRNYAALKVGEVIYFQYVKNDYFLEVLECKPASHGAISIIEANLEVDFAPPDGYEEPTVTKPSTATHTASSSSSSPAPFNMDEDTNDGEVDDLGVSDDSEEDEAPDSRRPSSASKRSNKTPTAFSGQGHRPSGKAVVGAELSLPELASSPSGRKFITSSGSLVIGPPKDSSSSSSSTTTTSNAAPSPSPAAQAAAARAAAAASSSASASSSKPGSPKPSVGTPVASDDTKAAESKFVPFSGSGFRLK
jgi:hypothetical protein